MDGFKVRVVRVLQKGGVRRQTRLPGLFLRSPVDGAAEPFVELGVATPLNV